MHIIEIVLEGFKSYSERTVISGWDTQFNCITGLNGSGKSNILDAICFVLGISTLSTVRAHSQQDLIYKRGQAGITRASVSIVFDNSDKEHSPAAYKDLPIISVTRQIVVGGTSKYLVAGHRVQQNVVQQMFQEVQLNVNNPNFLIMQGQITKVVNMRSTEILGLIEEAAGTGVYQKQRAKTIKELQNLDKPFAESEALLKEEVMPKLAQMRAKKTTYLEYQKSAHSLERLEQTVQVSLFDERVRSEQRLREQREGNETRIAALSSSSDVLTDEASSLEARISEMQRAFSNAEVNRLTAELTKLTTDLTTSETDFEIKTQAFAEQTQRITALGSEITELEVLARPCEEQLANDHVRISALETQLAEKQKRTADKQEVLHGLRTGVSASGGQETGFAFAAKRARDSLAESEGELISLQARTEQLTQQIHNNAASSVDEAQVQQLQNQVDDMQDLIERKQTELAAAEPQQNKAADIQEELSVLKETLVQLQRDARAFVNENPGLEPPSVNGVIGPVISCFKIAEKHANKQTALELCAGGALWNIVVDNERVGSEVIRRAKKRVNVLPLNRMNTRPLSRDRVKQIDADNVWLALDLLEFDRKYEAALAHVFGRTVICTTPALAQRAAYQFKMRAITLRGDVFDPRGIVSGGSVNKPVTAQSRTVFEAAQAHSEAIRSIHETQDRLKELSDLHNSILPALAAYQSLKNEVPVLAYKLELLQQDLERAASSSRSSKKLQEELDSLTTNKIPDAQRKIGIAKADLAQAMTDIEEMSTNRQGKLDALEKELVLDKKSEQALTKQISAAAAESAGIKKRLAELTSDLDSKGRMLEELRTSHSTTADQLKESESLCARITASVAEVERKLESERTRSEAQSQELKRAESRLFEVRSQIASITCEVQEIENALETIVHSHDKVLKELANDKKEYPWVESLHARTLEDEPDLIQHGEELKRLKANLAAEKQKLAEADFSFDSQIVTLVEQLEAREKALLEHIATIKEDKIKIQQSMAILDKKRTETINQVWQKVSEDFGLIFGDLLVDAGAELLPINNPLEEGFQIRVRLGSTWKEGLTELSGGQRSLVALSLILALLQYHPAPVYILDEVDAALDANHTRNIGHIIKTRFQNAQFIIVSLKDDMFSNANRIFQTRFIEGKSTVSIIA